MNDDPIVEEIHAVRRKLLEECGGNLEKLMDQLKSREKEHPSRIVSEVREVRRSPRTSH